MSKFSPHRNGEFSLYRKLYTTEIKVDYSTLVSETIILHLSKKGVLDASRFAEHGKKHHTGKDIFPVSLSFT